MNETSTFNITERCHLYLSELCQISNGMETLSYSQQCVQTKNLAELTFNAFNSLFYSKSKIIKQQSHEDLIKAFSDLKESQKTISFSENSSFEEAATREVPKIATTLIEQYSVHLVHLKELAESLKERTVDTEIEKNSCTESFILLTTIISYAAFTDLSSILEKQNRPTLLPQHEIEKADELAFKRAIKSNLKTEKNLDRLEKKINTLPKITT